MKLKKYKNPCARKHTGILDIKSFRNYLSWWIANLGVVPWLLFAFFLFFPALVFLRALLFFVTRVFETILFLLQLQRTQLCELCRIKYLPRMGTSVKAFSLGLFLLPALTMATSSTPLENQSLVLSIGEIKEIQLPSLKRFTMGETNSVSHKFLPQGKRLLIKAKKLGLSELHVWNKDGSKKKYQIYVLSRTNRLKLLSLAESLNSLGMKASIKGTWIELTGEINKASAYKRFLTIKKNNLEKLQSNFQLSRSLKKTLLSETIKTLFDDHIAGFRCEFQSIELICHLSDGRNPSPEVEKHLKKKLGVVFIRHHSNHKEKTIGFE